MLLFFVPILIILSRVESGQAYDARKWPGLYSKIDKYLTKEVKTDDVVANMDAAAAWKTKLEESEGRSCFFNSNCDLIDAIETLMHLRKIVDSKSCSIPNRTIVDQNDDAAGKPGLNLSYRSPPVTRIAKIVYHYASEYYKECHPNILGPKFKELNKQTFDSIIALSDNDVIPSEKYTFAFGYRDILRKNGKANVERSRNYQVKRDDLRKFIVEPCKELQQVFGDKFYDYYDRFLKSYDTTMDEYDLYAKERLILMHCQFIVDHEERIWSDIEKLVVDESKPVTQDPELLRRYLPEPPKKVEAEEKKEDGHKSRLLFLSAGIIG